MSDKEFTYQDVAEHNTKKDLFVVIHDKVYNSSSFIDEHPYVFLPVPGKLWDFVSEGDHRTCVLNNFLQHYLRCRGFSREN